MLVSPNSAFFEVRNPPKNPAKEGKQERSRVKKRPDSRAKGSATVEQRVGKP
jgi:hypothetical protein